MSKEIIKEIKEVELLKIKDKEDTFYYSGYSIKTNKQEILLLIQNEQYCCENWGYFCTEDNYKDFIGAELYDIKITDTALNAETLKVQFANFEEDAMFIDLNTNRGTLQFVIYNMHNGYYGHEVRVISNQLQYDSYL